MITDTWLPFPGHIPAEAIGPGFPGHTCGIAYARSRDEWLVLARADPAVHRFAPDGSHRGSWGDSRLLPDAHGLTIATAADGRETLWLTDRASGHVGEYDLDGTLLRTLLRPDLPVYASGGKPWKPTWVAVLPEEAGLWVADGYGAGLVHRYAADGRWIDYRDGSGDPGLPVYDCPHGLGVRERPGCAPEIWLTDRNPGRIRIYDLEGQFLRAIDGVDAWPCSFAFHGDLVAIPQLKTGLRILVGDRIVADLGPNAWAKAGWPAPKPADADERRRGRFHCPHHAAFAPDGSLLVGELVDGGRLAHLRLHLHS